MWRLVVAAIVVGALAFVGVLPAAAFDYQEPAVPSLFLMAAQPAAPTLAPTGGTVFFRLAVEDVGTAAAVPSMTGSGVTQLQPYATGFGGPSEGGGWALWNWPH